MLALTGPHNPCAVAVMVAVPLNPDSQFISPVFKLMEPAPAGDLE
jgi:hypothetical protein